MEFTTDLDKWVGRKFAIYTFLRYGDTTSGIWEVNLVTCSCIVSSSSIQLLNPEIHISNGAISQRYPASFFDELKTPSREDVLDEIKWRASLSGVTKEQKAVWKLTHSSLTEDPSIVVARGGWCLPEDWKTKKELYQPWKKK